MLVTMCLCRCCNGLFEDDLCLAEHVRECDGDAFKSPAQLFACERDRFLALVASSILRSEEFETIRLAANECWQPKSSASQHANKGSDLPELSKLVSDNLCFLNTSEDVCLEAKHRGKNVSVEEFEEFKSGSESEGLVLENSMHCETQNFNCVHEQVQNSCSLDLGSSSDSEYIQFSSKKVENDELSNVENVQLKDSVSDQDNSTSTLLSILNTSDLRNTQITSDSCIFLNSCSSLVQKPSSTSKESLDETVNTQVTNDETHQSKEICHVTSQSAYALLQSIATASGIKQEQSCIADPGESPKMENSTEQKHFNSRSEKLVMGVENIHQSVACSMNNEGRPVSRQKKTTSAGNKAKLEAMKQEILPLCTLIPMDTNLQLETKFRCNLCGHTSVHIAVMHRHLQQTHNNGGEFQCDQCNYRCNRRSKMTQHQARHSQKLLCHQCTATFVDMSSLNRHIMCKHTDNSVLKCHLCDFVAPHSSGLTEHLRKHTGDMLSCNFTGCNYQTPYQRALRVHQRRHTADKTFTCNLCNYQTPESYCLSRHLKTHEKSRPFKCSNCSFTGITRYEVLRHIRSKHFQQKRFACDKCSFRTSYANSIVKHLLGHMGSAANLYACPVCQEQFNTTPRAKKHMQRQHGRNDMHVLVLQEPVKINVADYLCIDNSPVNDVAAVESDCSGMQLTTNISDVIPEDADVGASVDPMKLSFHFSDLVPPPPLPSNTVSITRSSSIPDLFTFSGMTSSMRSSSQSDLLTFSGINITRSNSMSDLVSFASSMCGESSGPLHMDVSLSDATAPSVDMPALSLVDGTQVSLGEETRPESPGVVLAIHCSNCSALLINNDDVDAHNRACNGLVQIV